MARRRSRPQSPSPRGNPNRPQQGRSQKPSGRPQSGKPSGGKASSGRPFASKSSGGKSSGGKSSGGKSAGGKKPFSSQKSGGKFSYERRERPEGAPRVRKAPNKGRVRPARPVEAESGGDESAPVRERLQKVLAAAGIASRRECEELIVAGRVEVDRKTVVELGTRVDPLNQEIRVDGVALPRPKRLYFALHKPPGVVTTNYDPSGRPRVIDLIPTDQRVFPVGRLDRTSEGLILVTNDGALANLLTHPRYGVDKTYLALVDGHPDHHTLDKLRQGVHIAEGLAQASDVKVKRRHPTTTELIIVLDEGRNRQIRRMLARVGHKVLRLKRIAVGPLVLGDMPPGAHRKLHPQEVELLIAAVHKKRKDERKRRKRKSDEKPGGDSTDAAARKRRPRDESARDDAAGGESYGGGDGGSDFDRDDDGGFGGAGFGGGFGDDVLLSEESLGGRTSDSTGAVLDWNDDEDDEA
ncbi:MAG: pseudouridine synthase [Pirellulales bacterium]